MPHRLALGERVWRVRKHHVWIDAQLRRADDRTSVELEFFYDGQLLFAQGWLTREDALADASSRLRELQRAGWSTHW